MAGARSAWSLTGGLGALAWVALKVGALSFGGGFVIIPLMQADAVHRYHWMTNAQFLNAVALGQITPGPVVQTVAVVGYAAAGVGGALLAALVAFAPSFVFILAGGRHFERAAHQPAGAVVPRRRRSGRHRRHRRRGHPLGAGHRGVWQVVILAGSLVVIVGLRRSVVLTLVAAGVIGAVGAGPGPARRGLTRPARHGAAHRGLWQDEGVSEHSGYPGAPPGWYPDPAGGPGQRWWDGYAWTEATVLARDRPHHRHLPAWADASPPRGPARRSRPGRWPRSD